MRIHDLKRMEFKREDLDNPRKLKPKEIPRQSVVCTISGKEWMLNEKDVILLQKGVNNREWYTVKQYNCENVFDALEDFEALKLRSMEKKRLYNPTSKRFKKTMIVERKQ